jgi:hypothetical protein
MIRRKKLSKNQGQPSRKGYSYDRSPKTKKIREEKEG